MTLEIIGFICFFGIVAACSYKAGHVKAEASGILVAIRTSDWSYRQGYHDAKNLSQKRMTLVGSMRRWLS